MAAFELFSHWQERAQGENLLPMDAQIKQLVRNERILEGKAIMC
jgi:hypothetical protein